MMPRRGARLLFGVALLASCRTESNFLGFDRVQVAPTTPATSGSPAPVLPPASPEAGVEPPAAPQSTTSTVIPSVTPSVDAGTTPEPSMDAAPPPTVPPSMDASRDAAPPSTTQDAAPTPIDAGSREPPPNHFVEVLQVPPQAVTDRIEAAFQQLFHGDPSAESIYFEVGEDEAYIYDRAHEDTRMDAIGYGLFIAAQLDHREEFDRVWTFAKNHMQFTMGSHAGYFSLKCATSGEACSTESAVLGTFFTATALFFAEARWGNGEGTYDYGTHARAILDLMRNIEERNRGVLDGVTNAFNSETSLPQKEPTIEERDFVMPGVVWPAFFEIWAEKTGDSYWKTVAEQSRAYLNVASHPDTGLYPHTTTADGVVAEGFVTTDANTRSFETFDQDTYGVALSLALDQTWFGVDSAQVDIANRIVTFFEAYGGSYPAIYLYTGAQQNSNASGALVAMNGAVAGISTIEAREAFIRVVWNTPTPVGFYRYFDGVTQLLSLMYLGGALRLY